MQDTTDTVEPGWTFKPEIHPKLRFFLTTHKRFKVAHGGRAGRKSYSIADAAISRMIQCKCDVVVCREFDTTIRSSVHKLLKERISYHGIGALFDITDTEIRCKNGSVLVYRHLHNNIDEIKGLQGFDICWIFEAQSLQKESFDVLWPTILRKANSEIWVEFNPDNDDDFVMTRFVYGNDPDVICAEISYLDNTLIDAGLMEEAEKCKRNTPEDYDHIWLGKPSKVGSRIYPGFDPTVHVRDIDFNRLNGKAMYFMGQDPATVYYPFAVWIARIERNDREFDYIIYNEFPTVSMMGGKYFYEIRNEKICNVTLKQRASMFRVLDNTIDDRYPFVSIKARGIDTRFVKASGAASTTMGGTKGLIVTMADPQHGGMVFETPPEKDIDCQRDNIKELLDYDKDLGLIPGINEPHFYVMPHCHNVIDAFKHHRMDKQKRVEDQKRKDPIDAIRITMATMKEYAHEIENEKEVQAETFKMKSAVDLLKDTWMNNN